MSDEPYQEPRLPRFDIKTGFNHSPHIVILGAGASRACCPTGDRNGRTLPLMNDFIECVGIEEIIRKSGQNLSGNFETIYSRIYRNGDEYILSKLDAEIRTYFSQSGLCTNVRSI
jgi:hypothetical protein